MEIRITLHPLTLILTFLLLILSHINVQKYIITDQISIVSLVNIMTWKLLGKIVLTKEQINYISNKTNQN